MESFFLNSKSAHILKIFRVDLKIEMQSFELRWFFQYWGSIS